MLVYRQEFNSVLLYLFPSLRSEKKADRNSRAPQYEASKAPGAIASRDRLDAYLQQTLSENAPDLAQVSRFILEPVERETIANQLEAKSAISFFHALSKASVDLTRLNKEESIDLAMKTADLLDLSKFAATEGKRWLEPLSVHVDSLIQLISTTYDEEGLFEHIARRIIESPGALTHSIFLMSAIAFPEHAMNGWLANFAQSLGDAGALDEAFLAKTTAAIKSGFIFRVDNFYTYLRIASKRYSAKCPEIFAALTSDPQHLDRFAKALITTGYGLSGGFYKPNSASLTYLEAFTTLENLRMHAESRLSQSDLPEVDKIVWTVIMDGKSRSSIDGHILKNVW